LYVECERGTYKNPKDRHRKWDLYYSVSNGHFLVITPDESATEKIQREITEWAQTVANRPLTFWIAEVTRATTADDFWTKLSV
jgi:hypothetical protein